MEKKSRIRLTFFQFFFLILFVHHFRRLATTHFEPTYARRAFPCFDEPELKAEFVLTIIHRQDMKVFFNMPLLVQTTVKGTEDLVNLVYANLRRLDL